MNENLQLTKIVAFLKELKEEIEKNGRVHIKKMAIHHKIIGSSYVSLALSELNYAKVVHRVGATEFLLTTIDKKVAENLLKAIRNNIKKYNKNRKSNIDNEEDITIKNDISTTQYIPDFGGVLAIKNGFYILGKYKISGTFEIEKYEI